MNGIPSLSGRLLLTFVLPITLAVTCSGCVLLGLGAAAVGGCALLDENEDERVTQEELSRGIFDAWDTDDDDSLSEAEFNAGVERRDIFEDWSDNFDDWDADDDDSLSESEFRTGVGAEEDTASWADRQCDDLGL